MAPLCTWRSVGSITDPHKHRTICHPNAEVKFSLTNSSESMFFRRVGRAGRIMRRSADQQSDDRGVTVGLCRRLLFWLHVIKETVLNSLQYFVLKHYDATRQSMHHNCYTQPLRKGQNNWINGKRTLESSHLTITPSIKCFH